MPDTSTKDVVFWISKIDTSGVEKYDLTFSIFAKKEIKYLASLKQKKMRSISLLLTEIL